MNHLNWFDAVLILILLSSAVTGLRAGLARVIIGIVASLVGLLAGFWCYGIVAAKLMPWIHTPTVANILGFLVIFVGVLIVGSLISALVSKLFRRIGLSWFNHLLGGVAGALRGILIIAALVDIVVAFSPSPPPSFLDGSRLLPYATQISSWLADAAPRELKDAFDEQMRTIKRFWTPRQNRAAQEV